MPKCLKKILRTSPFSISSKTIQKDYSEFNKPFDPKNSRSSKVKFSELYCSFHKLDFLKY